MIQLVPHPKHHFNRGAKRAREARRDLGLAQHAPLDCLLTVVEEAGAQVVAGGLRDDVDGACLPGGLLFLDCHGKHPRRLRFTLAHELGHFWMDHPGRLLDDAATRGSGAADGHEREAYAFASEFLMPKEGVQDLLAEVDEPTLEQVVRVACAYGTSAAATVVRLQSCAKVSRERAARLFAEIEEGAHLELPERLGLEEPDDRLASLDPLPYVSPKLGATALGAALRGECSAEDAAAAAGIPAGPLRSALELLAAPEPQPELEEAPAPA